MNKFLQDLALNIRNERDSIEGSRKPTNRAKYIIDSLKNSGIKSLRVDKFYDEQTKSKIKALGFGFTSILKRLSFKDKNYYYNIEVSFKSKIKTKRTIIFTAHHDVVNVKSQNCQDNTTSVVNLMNFCLFLKECKDLKTNVVVVFTDCEEKGMFGANRLSDRILKGMFGDVFFVANSELTGVGDTIWCEALQDFGSEQITTQTNLISQRSCPPSDSFAFRRNGIKSACFGLLPREEYESVFPKTWGLCHSMSDTIDKINEQDMERYVEFLKKLI